MVLFRLILKNNAGKTKHNETISECVIDINKIKKIYNIVTGWLKRTQTKRFQGLH